MSQWNEIYNLETYIIYLELHCPFVFSLSFLHSPFLIIIKLIPLPFPNLLFPYSPLSNRVGKRENLCLDGVKKGEGER